MIRKSDTHVYLASTDPIQNLAPALDPGFGPEKAIIVSAKNLAEYAVGLSNVFQAHDIDACVVEFDNDWDLSMLRDRFLSLIADLSDSPDDGEISLNVTGGSRPLAIAAFEVFQELDMPVYYFQAEYDRIVWLNPVAREAFDLYDRVNLRHYLQAHNIGVVSTESRHPIKSALSKELVGNPSRFSKPVTFLNLLATCAEELNTLQVSISRHPIRGGSLYIPRGFDDLINLLERDSIASVHDDQLTFSSEEARFFAAGGWLEEYIHGELIRLRDELRINQDTSQGEKCEIRGLARSVKIARGQGKGNPVHNELDLAFLFNNRFHIIECKTRRFTHARHDDGMGAETIYKLDTLREILGDVSARGLVVSYKKFKQKDINRAKDLGIEVIDYMQLSRLSELLESWVRMAAVPPSSKE